MNQALYTTEYRRRSRQAKAKARNRCRCCLRRKRASWWQVWRPRQLNTHHLVRYPGAPLLVLCRFCHMALVHWFEDRSPFPLWLDTLIVLALVRIAQLATLAALVALILWRT